MKTIDREALELAMTRRRAESQGASEQLDYIIARDGWEKAGQFASYCGQMANLRLRPWQAPPVWVEVGEDDDPRRPDAGRRAASELLARMLPLGISKFHPDPLRAIAEAEAKPSGRASSRVGRSKAAASGRRRMGDGARFAQQPRVVRY